MFVVKKGEWAELIIKDELNGLTIDKLLKEIWHAPKGLIHEWRTGKRIKVNGEFQAWSKDLKKDDRLQIHLFPTEDYGLLPNFLDIQVLYEDDHIIIVNKPSNMDTHPNGEGQMDTLANGVAYHLLLQGVETKVRHIHRLDKDTTGAVLFAKHALAGAIMDKMLEQRMIKRTYLALVHGKIKAKKGTIDQPIGRDRHHSTRRRVSPSGKSAETRYEVLDYYSKKQMTLVKLQLQTGRTHQIRVHMSHIGHPLVGDSLYGGRVDSANRQALHAAKIMLPHPLTNEKVEVVAPYLDEPKIFEYDIDQLII